MALALPKQGNERAFAIGSAVESPVKAVGVAQGRAVPGQLLQGRQLVPALAVPELRHPAVAQGAWTYSAITVRPVSVSV